MERQAGRAGLLKTTRAGAAHEGSHSRPGLVHTDQQDSLFDHPVKTPPEALAARVIKKQHPVADGQAAGIGQPHSAEADEIGRVMHLEPREVAGEQAIVIAKQ